METVLTMELKEVKGQVMKVLKEKCEILKFQGICMFSYLMSGKEQEDQVGGW